MALTRRLFASLLLLPTVSPAHARDSWLRYRNARFGTSIEYPSRFQPLREPDNGDGQRLTASDGAELRVWGALNTNALDQDTLERQERERHAAGESIFGAERGQDWFAFIGRRGPMQLFHRHYLLSHGHAVINAFDIGYSQDREAEYGFIIARMARSLRPGRGQVR